ncbi:MAG TPA: protein-disulfide reductase DsbD domain-containing protein [Verrucomicrobiales bacterium]|nr:protein-disulfide reductase DsbD domain-containing protein [Verrucomicrobiales bacterium]
MRFRHFFTASLAASLLLAGVAAAQDDPFAVPGAESSAVPVQASLVAEQDAIVPGQTFTVALNLKHGPTWHTYWRNGGFPAQPTTIEWTLPNGFKETGTAWPIPEIHDTPEVGTQHTYHGDIYILTDFAAPASLKAGEKVTLKASAKWLQCEADKCVPGGKDVELTLPIADKAAKVPAVAASFDAVRKAQPAPVPSWKVSVAEKDGGWEIKAVPGEGASPDPGDLYFFDAASAIAPNALGENQTWKTEGTARVLTIKKNEEFPTKATPWGYIKASKSWVAGSTVTYLPVGAAPAASAAEAPAKPAPNETPQAQPPPQPTQAKPAANVDEQIATILSWGVRPLGEKEESGSLTVPLAILFAFLGGMILNLMPCVFPVLVLKILGFIRQSGEDKAVVRKHALVYAAGVIASMLVLLGVLLVVRARSEAAGWGFHLQNPVFVAFLIILIFAFSLNMAGVFEFGTSLTGVGAELQDRSGYQGSFFSGLLTVLLATPCTGPFMAPALGFALNKDTAIWLVIAVFVSLAIGLALPYVLLSWFPALIKKLPKPGAWMETFKQLMAFPMFATAVWLVTVFGRATGQGGLAMIMFALVFFAMALWLYGRFGTPMAKPRSKHIALTVAVLCVLAGGWITWGATNEEAPEAALAKHEVPLSAETIIARREKGQTTVVDFWAVWCLQCQANKLAAFDKDAFKNRLAEYNAIFMLADQTRPNPLAEKFLKAYQAGGIPYALVIPPTGPAIQLPQVIPSPATLIEALEEAKKQSAGNKSSLTKR